MGMYIVKMAFSVSNAIATKISYIPGTTAQSKLEEFFVQEFVLQILFLPLHLFYESSYNSGLREASLSGIFRKAEAFSS